MQAGTAICVGGLGSLVSAIEARSVPLSHFSRVVVVPEGLHVIGEGVAFCPAAVSGAEITGYGGWILAQNQERVNAAVASIQRVTVASMQSSYVAFSISDCDPQIAGAGDHGSHDSGWHPAILLEIVNSAARISGGSGQFLQNIGIGSGGPIEGS